MESCIYMIYNLSNGKCYIGSTKNFKKRIIQHKYKLKKNIHHSIYLQRAWNINSNNFEFVILQFTTDLFRQEEKWIKRIQPEYNLGSIGGGDNISNHPNLEQIKNKQSEIQQRRISELTVEQKKQIYGKSGDKNPNWKGGISRPKCLKCNLPISQGASVCHNCRMSDFFGQNNSFYNKRHTDETKRKLSEYRKQNSKNARKIEIDGVIYISSGEASRELGIPVETIRYRAKNSIKGFKFI